MAVCMRNSTQLSNVVRLPRQPLPSISKFSEKSSNPVLGRKRRCEALDGGPERKRLELRKSSTSSKTQSSYYGCPISEVAKNPIAVAEKKTCGKVSSTSTSEKANSPAAAATTGSVDSSVNGSNTASDVELSPRRALRLAKLKERFGGLILKAQQHKLFEPGAKIDSEPLRRKEEKLQRRQPEGTKVKAQIKDDELSAQSKAEIERKRQIQEQRKAARLALEKLEQSVVVEDNFKVMRDFEALIGCRLWYW